MHEWPLGNLSGLNDLPGILLLESRSLIDDPFYLGFSEEFLDGFGNQQQELCS